MSTQPTPAALPEVPATPAVPAASAPAEARSLWPGPLPPPDSAKMTRRDALSAGVRGAALLGLGGLIGGLAGHSQAQETVWQIDPNLCTNCGKCATECVLAVSAVRCVHAFASCGYCLICSGYQADTYFEVGNAAENCMCPTDAIKRVLVPEDPHGDGYQYHVEAEKCIACARCTKGCDQYGNGSLYLQVDHSKCVDCNICRISLHCPAEAFKRVSRAVPYLEKKSIRSKEG